MNDSPASGTVIVVLSGHGQDLLKLALFLEAVTLGRSPADVLRELRLDAIRITSTRGTGGRGDRVTLTLQLEEPAR